MIRVLCILGTRPEAIKMAPVVRELQKHPQRFLVRTCATAQHREMLDQALALFGITPDVDLDLMQAGQTPSQVASRVLAGLEPLLQAQRPDWVLVQGDTTTVLASAIAAHHQRVRVGHVEAGLRTGDRWNPFPEEMNRSLTDHLSDLCFAPTERARQNLLREGIPERAIRVTGNTVVDALLWAAEQPPTPEVSALLRRIGLSDGPSEPIGRPWSADFSQKPRSADSSQKPWSADFSPPGLEPEPVQEPRSADSSPPRLEPEPVQKPRSAGFGQKSRSADFSPPRLSADSGPRRLQPALQISDRLSDDGPKLILVTAHRRESFGQPLERICQALREIACRGAGRIRLVYPVHPNPNVQGPVHRLLDELDHVTLLPPVDYLTLVQLMKRSALILTDSGGIQEEAPSLGVPVLVLREVTERPEAVEAGVARVVGTASERIVAEVFRLLDDPRAYAAMARPVNPYGDGRAAERIVEALMEWNSSFGE